MNGRVLVDTNVIVELFQGNIRVAQYLNEYEVCISAITEIELFSNPSLTKSQLIILRKFIQNCNVFDDLNTDIKLTAANYRRSRQIRKTPDAIIAATAKYYNLSLFTFDIELSSLNDIDIILIK